MNTRWEDLATRARGLATHLLDRAELDRLSRADNLETVRDALRARGMPLPEGPVTSDELELGVRRAAAARLRVLARWAGSRSTVLAALFEDEDRRSLRALLRGAAQGAGAPSDVRLAGLIPTPTLPERAMVELAAQPTPAALAALLTAWDNPYGAALLPDAGATHPDLLALEHRITSVFAARALLGARRSHSAELVAYVQETIDLENACAALVLATRERELTAKQVFVSGGRRLPLVAFMDAAAAREPAEAGRRLAAALRPAALAVVFERARDPAAIEDALLRHRIAAQRSAELRNPAGIAAVLGYALRLRAESLDLRRVTWGITLAAPGNEIAGALVTA
jgi:vacuolar-type H+-ATPase subunit C/Vma6